MTPASLDEDLVRAAQAGSDEAFGRLVDRHQQALRGFLRRATGDWALADDLAQETFLTAWEKLGRADPAGNVRAWLCGIGYNKCLTVLRSGRRAQAREKDYHAMGEGAGASSPEDRLALEQALASLSVEQRAAVALCLADGLSHADAAEALGLPLGTVKSHVTRGRARLLEALGGRDGQG